MRAYFRERARGQGLVEYALILVLVAIAVILVLSVTGQKVGEVFCDVVLKIGGKVPNNLQMCAAPRVSISGIAGGQVVSGDITVEAIIQDDKGLGSNITSVEFFIDGVSKTVEHVYKYCLGGYDDYCHPYSVSSGTHTLRVVATDADHNTGETSVTFTVAP